MYIYIYIYIYIYSRERRVDEVCVVGQERGHVERGEGQAHRGADDVGPGPLGERDALVADAEAVPPPPGRLRAGHVAPAAPAGVRGRAEQAGCRVALPVLRVALGLVKPCCQSTVSGAVLSVSGISQSLPVSSPSPSSSS